MEEQFVPDAYDKLKPVHLQYARSFLQAAIALDNNGAAGPVGRDMDPPVYLLSAVGAELTFKACLAYAEVPEGKIVKFGHDLKALLNSVRARAACRPILDAAEVDARARWRDLLRSTRDGQRSKVTDPVVQIWLTDELPSNPGISSAIPHFVDAVKWLSDRNKDQGGTLRYVRTGFDHRPHIAGFGIEILQVPRTIHWVCMHILQQLEDDLRRTWAANAVHE